MPLTGRGAGARGDRGGGWKRPWRGGGWGPQCQGEGWGLGLAPDAQAESRPRVRDMADVCAESLEASQ